MAKRIDTSDWSISDKRYGWKYGCDGFVSATEAARMLGKSTTWISDALNSEERKRPGGIGFPLRAGKPREHGRTTKWAVCAKSIEEYLKRHAPVEF